MTEQNKNISTDNQGTDKALQSNVKAAAQTEETPKTDEAPKTSPEGEAASAHATHCKPTMAWISLVLAIASWCILLWLNGYVALFAAILAAVAGFMGASHASTATRRLATTAIIAAMVLIVVVASYLIVLKIGLS